MFNRRHLLLLTSSIIAHELARASGGIPQTITISRELATPNCTGGYIAVDGAIVSYTLELPDRDNVNDISRIPAGRYPAHVRYDHADKWRVELEQVPGRTNVQIHIGNYPEQSKGCILVGMKSNNCQVFGSSNAYGALRKALYGSDDPRVAAALIDLTVEVAGNANN